MEKMDSVPGCFELAPRSAFLWPFVSRVAYARARWVLFLISFCFFFLFWFVFVPFIVRLFFPFCYFVPLELSRLLSRFFFISFFLFFLCDFLSCFFFFFQKASFLLFFIHLLLYFSFLFNTFVSLFSFFLYFRNFISSLFISLIYHLFFPFPCFFLFFLLFSRFLDLCTWSSFSFLQNYSKLFSILFSYDSWSNTRWLELRCNCRTGITNIMMVQGDTD